MKSIERKIRGLASPNIRVVLILIKKLAIKNEDYKTAKDVAEVLEELNS